VLFDRMNPIALNPGTVVVKVAGPGVGRMQKASGFAYVGDSQTGQFIGMVRLASLTPRKAAR
jgi:hypothetical protein